MKSKKIVIVILIVLMLLLIVGGAFAYAYIATDIFKTDQEMFFKYFAQITAEDGFIEKGIANFEAKKKQTPYENSGKISVDVEYPDEDLNNIIEKVNELAITFSGKVDVVKQKVEQNIEVDYGNDVIFPINYRQDGDSIGLQTDELSRKYIVVRNENLKQLVTNLGIQDVSMIPDVIEFSKITEGIKFSNEEIETLKQIYGNVLKQNLTEENFSSVKTEQNSSYTLELNNEQIKNIVIKILEATKENTLIIDKINEFILKQDSNAEKIDVSVIDDLINDIKDGETSNNLTSITDTTENMLEGLKKNDEADVADIPNLKLTLIQANKELIQIKIESGNTMISIGKSEATDSLSYNIESVIIKDDNENTSIFEEKSSTTKQYNMYFNTQYKGLDTLSAVDENYEFGFYTSDEKETMKFAYEIDTNTAFSTSVSIGNLDKTTSVFLNDYDKTQVTNFLAQVGTKILEINKNQMTELGLKEYENPILYSNPITMLGLTIYKMSNQTVIDSSLSDLEKQQFNEKFTRYEGDRVSSPDVNAMIHSVENSNLVNEDRIVKVTLDGVEVTEKVDSSQTYKVEAVYDDDGYIAEMRASTNN